MHASDGTATSTFRARARRVRPGFNGRHLRQRSTRADRRGSELAETGDRSRSTGLRRGLSLPIGARARTSSTTTSPVAPDAIELSTRPLRAGCGASRSRRSRTRKRTPSRGPCSRSNCSGLLTTGSARRRPLRFSLDRGSPRARGEWSESASSRSGRPGGRGGALAATSRTCTISAGRVPGDVDSLTFTPSLLISRQSTRSRTRAAAT